MNQTKYHLDVQPDFVAKQSSAGSLSALCEFIWNALDANSTKVEIFVTRSEFGVSEIIVRDNGDGMTHREAAEQFQKLGGSWKKPGAVTKGKNRLLHGREGRGRFRGFSLGNTIDWHVVGYNDSTKKFEQFDITVLKSKINELTISAPIEPQTMKTGVTVKVTDFDKDHRVLAADSVLQPLSEIFALYLKNYEGINISFDGRKIDPTFAIRSSKSYDIPPIAFEGKQHNVELEIIEWNTSTDKALYLCNQQGFPLSQVSARFHTGAFQFSAYLKSPFVEKLHNENRLELAEMEPVLNEKIEHAKELIKTHFRDRAAEEAKSLVDQWKDEEIYPYKAAPQSTVQSIEQKVFDIVAVKVNDFLPDFKAASKKQKALHLQLLKKAIEASPEDLQIILNEVLGLPKRQQAELAELLQETSLSAIISASKMIADRLRVLSWLESLLFEEDIKKYVKERSQLHRFIADHTWVFGEEYHLSVDDKSLTDVLAKHLKAKKVENIVVDKPVKRIDGKIGIVDLMVTRAMKTNRPEEELEHLVIELKAPSVKIGSREITQLEGYAFAVIADERFKALNVKWDFWVLSNDMDGYAEQRTRTSGLPRGVVHRSQDGRITLWVKTWGEVINANKARLKFIQEKLEYQVDKGNALRHLQETYKALIDGTEMVEGINKIVSAKAE